VSLPESPDPAAGAPEPGLPRRPRFEKLKTLLRRVALTSVMVNAVLGVWAIAGSLGAVEAHVLVTSLLVTGCGVVALACGTAVYGKRLGPLPSIGIAVTLAGFGLLAAATWQEFRVGLVWRLGVSLVMTAGVVAYASLMSGLHLEGRARRLTPTAYTLASLADAFLIAAVWGFDPGDSWRLFGVIWVLLGAATVAAPIAARLRPLDERLLIRFCPYCGAHIGSRPRRVTRCPRCHRFFRVVAT
jgi:hypothetical protein